MTIDPLTLTLIFILIVTLVAAIIRSISRDKCLLSFRKDNVTLELKQGPPVQGTLKVATTGLELVYTEKKILPPSRLESSFIFYKNEYPGMQALLRFHDQLDDKAKKARDRQLKKVYHPGILRKSLRKTGNILKSVRDSILEVVNVLINVAKTRGPAGAVMSGQEKYIHQVKSEIAGSVATTYEPLLEPYIGHKVSLEMNRDDQVIHLTGILKDYTAAFIEILDVDYPVKSDNTPRLADLVISRANATVRHWAE